MAMKLKLYSNGCLYYMYVMCGSTNALAAVIALLCFSVASMFRECGYVNLLRMRLTLTCIAKKTKLETGSDEVFRKVCIIFLMIRVGLLNKQDRTTPQNTAFFIFCSLKIVSFFFD